MASPPEKGKRFPMGAILLHEDKQLAVLAGLVEGNSERAVERMTGVNRETVGRLALRFGEGAQRLHDRLVRDLTCDLIDLDEMWSWCAVKGSRYNPAKHGPDAGEQWVWVGLDRLSKLAVSFYVGRRDQQSADTFIADLRSRLVVMPKLFTSDGLVMYEPAILASIGPSASYIQTIKQYKGGKRGPDHRYEPSRTTDFIKKKAILGVPDPALATTYAVERSHLTMRHHVGRMRRLCLAFSKKVSNHRAAVALNYMHYNFCLVVRTLRVTPAMAAGVASSPWELSDLLAALLAEPAGEKPVAKPLAHRVPETTARELPNGRGFLQVVGGARGGKGGPTPTSPEPTPAGPREHVTVPVSSGPAGQMDLLSWRPASRAVPPLGTQLDLFGLDSSPRPIQ
jgi:IS1 family transposase